MNELTLFFFSGATGEMKGSAIAQDFKISVDFLEVSNSTFRIALDDAEKLKASQNDIIFIPASELWETPFGGRSQRAASNRSGLCFFAKSTTKTEKDFSISAREALSLLDYQLHLTPSYLASHPISSVFAAGAERMGASAPFRITCSSSGSTSFASPPWQEGVYSLLDLLRYACQTSGCAGLGISSTYEAGELRIALYANWGAKADTALPLSLQSDFVGGYSVAGESDSPTHLVLAPASANSLSTETFDYYLASDGSVTTDQKEMALPEKREVQVYTDDQYYGAGGDPEANLLAIAKGVLAPTVEDKEISFAFKRNSLYPFWMLGGLMKARLTGRGVDVEASLTKIQLSNSTCDGTLTWGYQRSSLLSKIKASARKTSYSGGVSATSSADLTKVEGRLTAIEGKDVVGTADGKTLRIRLGPETENASAKKAPMAAGFAINDEKEEENTFSMGSATTSTGFKLKNI